MKTRPIQAWYGEAMSRTGDRLLEPLLTVEEAANLLRVKRNTLYTWAYRRQIPTQKVGKALRFQREDLEKWLKAQARTVCSTGRNEF